MNTTHAIDLVKQEAAKNPAANAALYVFALRKRTRHQVTLTSLVSRMKAEGFENFKAEDYAPLLKIMANAGFGKLATDAKGRVKGLKDINTTLQSIGAAAVSDVKGIAMLDKASPRHRFGKLSVPTVKAPTKAVEAPKAPVQVERRAVERPGIGITISINGKTLSVPVPSNFTADEIASLVSKFRFK